MAEQARDTIYIDVDDEITNVIDKVMESPKDLVALVLPKRASIFQSTVNMKLLKRKSEEVGKKVVLVTAEASLLPLAGAIGLFVARTLSSRPEIPPSPKFNQSIIDASEDEIIIGEALGAADTGLKINDASNTPIGQLASSNIEPIQTKLDKDLDTINLDNTPTPEEEPINTPKPDKKAKKVAKQKDKKLKIPNFKKFKLIMIIVIILLILGFLLYLALAVLPKATINIQTNASNVNTNIQFSLDPNASSLNQSTNNVPAREVKSTKTYTSTVNSTGQQNNGQKASGSVSFTVQECPSSNNSQPSQPNDIAAGTGIVQNNLTYITQSTAQFGQPTLSHGFCLNYNSNSVNIIAQQGGSNYNTNNSDTTFSVPGQSAIGTGGANGGTDNIVTVVSQADITNATNKISANNSGVQNSLSSQLTQSGFFPIALTFSASQPSTTENNQPGSTASSVTVTETINYTMYGARKADINTLLDNNINSQVGSSQSILSTGLNGGSFSYTNGNSSPLALTLQTTAIVGPNINIANIKNQIEGKKIAQIKQIIMQNSNVTGVNVSLSPFYVSTAPSNPNKIDIKVAKPTKTNGG